jgi:hypothetical protein
MPSDELAKEPSHFADLIEWYRSDDQYFSIFKDAQPRHRWIGEASTAYLTDPSAAANIYKYNPDARIIIVLRNPADRAYSLYCWMVQEGYESKSTFEKALDAEAKRAKGKIPNFWEPQYFYNFMYFGSGLYHDQVKRYVDLFKQNVLVMTFEELLASIKDDYAPVRQFLGIGAQHATPEVSNPSVRVVHPALQFWLRKLNNRLEHNARTKEERDALMQRGIREGKPPPLQADTRATLLQRYREDILATAQLINKNLDQWFEEKRRG